MTSENPDSIMADAPSQSLSIPTMTPTSNWPAEPVPEISESAAGTKEAASVGETAQYNPDQLSQSNPAVFAARTAVSHSTTSYAARAEAKLPHIPLTDKPQNDSHGWRRTIMGTSSSFASNVTSMLGMSAPKTAVSTKKDQINHLVEDYSLSSLAKMFLKERERCANMEHAIASLNEEIRNLRHHLVNMQSQVESQESIVRKAQESAFVLMETSKPNAEDDDIIREKLTAIMNEWRPFTRSWAIRSLDDIDEKEMPALETIVKEFMAEDELFAPDGIFKSKTKAPTVFLNATLAMFIERNIIDCPFNCLHGFAESESGIKSDPRKYPEVFQTVYDVIGKDDHVSAQLWRSQTVSSVNSSKQSLRISAKDRNRKPTRQDQFYHDLVCQFELKAKLLLRKCSEADLTKRQNQLFEIFADSGDLFSSLWAQRTRICTFGLPRLRKQTFNIDHEYLEAHAYHKLDERDTSMDGMPVQMVVQPAIVAYGNEYGQDYNIFKVWAKAVVWLSHPAATTHTDAET